MRRLILIASFLTLAGCPLDPNRVLKNPKIDDLIGAWEGTSIAEVIPYALVEIKSNSTGVVVLAGEKAVQAFGELQKFEFYEKSFSFELVIFGEEPEVGLVKAQLIHGQLCVVEFDGEKLLEEGTTWCFIRKENLKKYQEDAKEEYQAYENKGA